MNQVQKQHETQGFAYHAIPRWVHECADGVFVHLSVKVQQCSCGASLQGSKALRVPELLAA